MNIFFNDFIIDRTSDDRLWNNLNYLWFSNHLLWDWFFSNKFNLVCLSISNCDNYSMLSWLFNNHSCISSFRCSFCYNWDYFAFFWNCWSFCQFSNNIFNNSWLLDNFDIICYLNLCACYCINTVLSTAWSFTNKHRLLSCLNWGIIANYTNSVLGGSFTYNSCNRCSQSCLSFLSINFKHIICSVWCLWFTNFYNLRCYEFRYIVLGDTLWNYQLNLISFIALFWNWCYWPWDWGRSNKWLWNCLHTNYLYLFSIFVINNIYLIFITALTCY
jgi:hypothetical protein